MTRETKVGLVVSGSFLCLVGIVLANKLKEEPPKTDEVQPEVAAAAATPPKPAGLWETPEKKLEKTELPPLKPVTPPDLVIPAGATELAKPAPTPPVVITVPPAAPVPLTVPGGTGELSLPPTAPVASAPPPVPASGGNLSLPPAVNVSLPPAAPVGSGNLSVPPVAPSAPKPVMELPGVRITEVQAPTLPTEKTAPPLASGSSGLSLPPAPPLPAAIEKPTALEPILAATPPPPLPGDVKPLIPADVVSRPATPPVAVEINLPKTIPAPPEAPALPTVPPVSIPVPPSIPAKPVNIGTIEIETKPAPVGLEPLPKIPAAPGVGQVIEIPTPERLNVTTPPTGVGTVSPVAQLGPPATTGHTPAIIPAAPTPPTKAGDVEWFDETVYTCQPTDTYETVARRYYGDKAENYVRALQQYNRQHPLATDALKQDPPRLNGQQVAIPNLGVLQKRYPQLIAGAGVARAETLPTYRVAKLEGESMPDIAKRLLNDERRWGEIAQLNKNFPPEYRVPAGAVLNLPADARVAVSK